METWQQPSSNRTNNFILASSCLIKLSRWKEGLNGFARLFHTDKLDTLKDELIRAHPDVLLLDHDLLGAGGVNEIAGLRSLSPTTKKIIMLKSSASDEEEWGLFKAGVRGCCRNDIAPESLKNIVLAVQQGELWMRRTLIYRLLDQLDEQPHKKNKVDRSLLGRLENLTQREYEIALRVGKGESNKRIAQSLDITERTVKAHLTQAFRKMGIMDRLKLALILSGEERQVRRGVTARCEA